MRVNFDGLGFKPGLVAVDFCIQLVVHSNYFTIASPT